MGKETDVLDADKARKAMEVPVAVLAEVHIMLRARLGERQQKCGAWTSEVGLTEGGGVTATTFSSSLVYVPALATAVGVIVPRPWHPPSHYSCCLLLLSS